MDTLIEALRNLEASECPQADEYLSEDDHPLIHEIGRMAEFLLVTDTGKCNWANISTLEEEGYHVFAVEQDGFGWLIGGICTKKGIITYG